MAHRHPTPSRDRPHSTPDRLRWERVLTTTVRVLDAICVVVALGLAQLTRPGASSPAGVQGGWDVPYAVLGIVLAVAWWFLLGVVRSRDSTVFGIGVEEFRRVAVASLSLFGVLAVLSVVFGLDMARGYVAVALPVGIVLLLLGRWILRRRLVALRRSGRAVRRVVLLGSPGAVRDLHHTLQEVPEAGYGPVAAILPGHSMKTPGGGQGLPVPVAGVSHEVEGILGVLECYYADALALSSRAELTPQTLNRLRWELAERRITLIVAPALATSFGSLVHSQSVAGLPLLQVSSQGPVPVS